MGNRFLPSKALLESKAMEKIAFNAREYERAERHMYDSD